MDLRLTLGVLGRGPHDPTTKWDVAGLWRTFLTPLGAVTLRLTQTRVGVDALAWGPGAHWALDGLPELLGASDDWSALDVSAHPLLTEVRRRTAGLRLPRTRRVFEALAPAVIEQKVTSLEAYRSWVRLLRAHGAVAPGPAPGGMRVAPSAEAWRRIPSWEWHRTGVDPQRSRSLVTAARVASGLERTAELVGGMPLPGEVVAARLRSVSGIGVWTAAETAQRAHGDPDAVSVGDYGLAAIVGYALTGSTTDDDGMLELLAPWSGQRQRVVRLIGASGVVPPRHGPRATITDHRRR
ncbi:MAG: DNA-3-methyladenine glycosylase 2 family protein [Microbacteriaceae bacterium]|nr:MAG: DNA-3-methyladenine glycosylase 2 family protein [Microbacteriaceae bacterium]